jgi:predicted secreted protein
MHGRRLIPLAIASLALGLAAAPASAKTVQVTEQDAGDEVTVRPGDRIRIVLPANETTGYRWEVTKQPRRRVARVVSSTYVPHQVDPPLVGSGGDQVTIVRAVRRGSTSLGMRYTQVGSNDLGSSFDLFIRVRPAR